VAKAVKKVTSKLSLESATPKAPLTTPKASLAKEKKKERHVSVKKKKKKTPLPPENLVSTREAQEPKIEAQESSLEADTIPAKIKEEPYSPSKAPVEETPVTPTMDSPFEESDLQAHDSSPTGRRRQSSTGRSRAATRRTLDGKVVVRRDSGGSRHSSVSPARRPVVSYVGGNAPKYHCRCEEPGCAWKGRKSRFLDHLTRKHNLPMEVAKEKVTSVVCHKVVCQPIYPFTPVLC